MDAKLLDGIIGPHKTSFSGLVHVARHLPGAELEVALTFRGSPNIPKAHFNQIYTQYKRNSSQFSYVSTWVEVRDNFFEDPAIRNRASLNPAFVDHEWIRKVRLVRKEFEVEQRPLHLRQNLKREIPIQPVQAEYVFVRTKKVCVFVATCFKTTFSIVWQGKTPEECQQAFPLYEIEVELLVDKIPEAMSDEEVACRFLHSVLLLQGLQTPCPLKEVLHR